MFLFYFIFFCRILRSKRICILAHSHIHLQQTEIVVATSIAMHVLYMKERVSVRACNAVIESTRKKVVKQTNTYSVVGPRN